MKLVKAKGSKAVHMMLSEGVDNRILYTAKNVTTKRSHAPIVSRNQWHDTLFSSEFHSMGLNSSKKIVLLMR